MKKRGAYTIVGLVVLFGLAAVWGGFQLKERCVAENQLVNKYNGAFYESLQRTKNVEALLSKGIASGSSDNRDNLFADLWYNANTAQASLHQLPMSHQVVEQTSKFLTQVGDYAYAITKRDQNKKLSERDRQIMSELYKKSQDLNRELGRVQRQVVAGNFSWTEVRQELNRNLSQGQLSGVDDSFRRVDSQMQEIPVLIYDGPFSDHLERAKPRGVTGDDVTAKEARNNARDFIDLKGADVSKVNKGRDADGRIPAYSFEFQIGDDNRDIITAHISKKGGHTVFYTNPRSVSESQISESKAKFFAQNFLDSKGIKNMVPTYTIKSNNVLTISFAYEQDEVIIYPDLIKVMVALDNGQILTYDALSFLMSHEERDLPQPRISIDEARKKLNPDLDVQSERMVLIPTSGKHEVLTYEFKTKMQKDSFLVYINAETGGEEQIFKLLETLNSTLVL